MPGPQPMPRALREVTGNPSNRKLPPEPPARLKLDKLPQAPNFLTEQGKIGWYDLARVLVDMRVLDQSNTAALAVLCELWIEWRNMRQDIARNGRYIIVTTGQGDRIERRRPIVEDLSKVESKLLQYFSHFGLTPSTFTKVGMNAGETPDNPEDSYFD